MGAVDAHGLKAIPYAQLDAWHLMCLRHRLEWLEQARADQVPPEDGWSLWLFLAGRGTGKTRTAAEHSWFRAAWRQNVRWLVAAPTLADIRDTCFEGESGIINRIPGQLVKKFNRSLVELELKNGSFVKGIPLFEPDRQRGPQWHGAWIDELAAAEKNKVAEAWKNLTLAVRLPGYNAEKVVTTTPKPIPVMQELLKRKGVVVTHATTYDNLKNLEQEFQDEVLKFEGTTYGRQEIYGELIDPAESGIIKRSWFKLWSRKKKLPTFKVVVQSYDTAFGEKQTEDEDNTACVVFGVFELTGKDGKPNGKHGVMVVDAWQDKPPYPELRERVFTEFADARYGEEDTGTKPSHLLIEQKSSGISLIQDLNNEGIPAMGYNPGRLDKTQRLHLVSYLVYNGLVFLPESLAEGKEGEPRLWAEELLETVCTFPLVVHDDYVDAFSQGLQFLADQGWLRVENTKLLTEDTVDYHALKKRRRNPYAE